MIRASVSVEATDVQRIYWVMYERRAGLRPLIRERLYALTRFIGRLADLVDPPYDCREALKKGWPTP